jgi:hypothetical protein
MMIEHCPICGLEMAHYVDKLDYILMEEYTNCPTIGHYAHEYVTGVTTVSVGGLSIGWNYNDSYEYIWRAGKIVDRLIERLKRRIK